MSDTDDTTRPAIPVPEAITRLRRDIRKANATLLSDDEARFLVDGYYIMQENRKRADSQVRALEKSAEPNEILKWFSTQSTNLEEDIKKVLLDYTSSKLVGRWMMSNYGIGPVISAGMLAHIDIRKAETAGAIWRFAGLDPTVKWGEGEKRPWNASLKTLCWKLGRSFMMFHNAEECFYGRIYHKRKQDYEIPRNDRMENKERAALILTQKRWKKTTDAYAHLSSGKLPPAQIDGMARRHAVKLFLSHLHMVWYFIELGRLPPSPYAIAVLGHAHFIPPPHIDVVPGLQEALSQKS